LFPTITRYLRGTAIADKLRMDLLRANLFLRPSEYIAIIIGSALMLFLLGRIFIANVWLLLGLAALGGFLPQLYVKNLQQRRLMALERQIPDALMLISASLRTGYSFLRAVQMVVDQMPPPISEEFARIVHDSNLGAPMEDALRHLVARVRSYNLELVVTAVLIQLETGGNLSEILENIAETIRERARIINEIRILTQEGKLSGILVGILPVAMGILLSIMNPSYMKPLVTTPMGKMMLGLGLGLQVLGALVIKKMIAIDV
ncbi:MAG: type II secretion system F family protein, partial [Candidatus Aenigmatarchaeota archaeon]